MGRPEPLVLSQDQAQPAMATTDDSDGDGVSKQGQESVILTITDVDGATSPLDVDAAVGKVTKMEPKGADVVAAEPEPEPEPEPEDSKTDEILPPKRTYAAPELRAVAWKEFKAIRTLDERNSSAIDVLMIGNSETLTILEEEYADMMAARKQKTTIPGDLQLPDGHQPLPERVRINSTVILKILGKIHETSITGTELQDEPAVIIRPFKSLVIYEQRLRALHKLLVDRFHVNTDAASSSSGGAVSVPEAQATGRDERLAEATPTSRFDDLVYSPTGLVHLHCLMEFIDTRLKARIDHLMSPDCKKVSFSDLWLLFKPGEFVIDQRERQCYRVISVTSAKHQATNPFEQYRSLTRSEDEETPVHVFCVYVDFDGKRLGPVPKLFTITRFEEEKNATDLEVYPIHLSDTPGLRQKLIDRGRLFLQVAGIKHMHYTGPTIDARDEVDSQVVVDFEETFTVEEHIKQRWRPDLQRDISMPLILKEKKNAGSCNWLCCVNENIFDDQFADERRNKAFRDSLYPPAWTQSKLPSVTIFPRELKETSTEENTVTDEELMIMSYRVFGFVLRSRKWAKLDLTYLRPVQTPQLGDENDKEDAGTGSKKRRKKSAFEQLVIPPKHKDMVMSVIAQHFRDKSRDKESGATYYSNQVDLVRGKGKGLILLLHGAPGVGKTSTAECVAELFQKPLFQITCGDLGTTAAAVDATLERNFALANKWDCILLLDEADVFLARRNTKDYVRNGLVAVFLRILEYYAGVLFLTTNRIGDFDEAFTSRVHISLHYPALDEQGTWQVFKINLERMAESFVERGRTLEVDGAEIAVFANKYFLQNPNARWNGRQIRNACSTALALAEYEAQGSKHDAVVRPDAVITLNQSHFETVAESYLKFIEYVRRIFATYPDDKASEDKLRAPLDRGGPPNPLAASVDGGPWVPKEMMAHEFHRHGGMPFPAQPSSFPAAPNMNAGMNMGGPAAMAPQAQYPSSHAAGAYQQQGQGSSFAAQEYAQGPSQGNNSMGQTWSSAGGSGQHQGLGTLPSASSYDGNSRPAGVGYAPSPQPNNIPTGPPMGQPAPVTQANWGYQPQPQHPNNYQGPGHGHGHGQGSNPTV
ncbi:hypothetical protein B0T22DRAFT_400636 [Podospora appendiculata]|uniref:AAA+ ATPase domain-containing protein n=1 Tax=Podospora appendiculata TaxID=314037 RepID=A0AAE1CFZ2_9PEZI|nr:hypothetical protein B0T22DRAFT_400636 [Podospora appendiculata]